MDSLYLTKLKERLLCRKNVLGLLLDDKNREIENLKERSGELSSYDNHPGDLASDTLFQSIDIGLKENIEDEYNKILTALAKMDSGEYGYCAICHKPIDLDRLEAMPEAVHCLACKKILESQQGKSARPIEEKVLFPPFGYITNEKENPVYDGEDTWQDIQIHGTSDTSFSYVNPEEYPRRQEYREEEEQKKEIKEDDEKI